jgi:hypothetical protein
MIRLPKAATFAFAALALLFSFNSFAAKGAGGGGAGGGGGGKAALVFPTSGSLVGSSGVPFPQVSITATSGIAQPVIALVSAPAGVSVGTITEVPAGKVGPLFITTLQLAPWTPTRDQIGTATAVFTATDGATTITYNLDITVQDAPAAVGGLTAASDGTQITASWAAPAFGGTGQISYVVQACYKLEIRTGFFASQCNLVATTPDTSVTFAAQTTDPAGGAYFEILVTPMDSVGVFGPMTLFLLP